MHQIIQGDARHIPLPDGSVDAIVTDPPYELKFMGRGWDSAGVSFDPAPWRECLRVLKDGGRMLAFGGSRTHHRIWCAIEDAGFVIEDTVMYMYGTGFPKAKSKLKPAFEPVCVARKGDVTDLNVDACRIGTEDTRNFYKSEESAVMGNHGIYSASAGRKVTGSESGRYPANVVLEHREECQSIGTRRVCSGTAVRRNIGESHKRRIFGSSDAPPGEPEPDVGHADKDGLETVEAWDCHPDCPVRLLDEQSGESESRADVRMNRSPMGVHGIYGHAEATPTTGYADIGGASRFFYTAKASRAERDAGLHDLEPGARPTMGSGIGGQPDQTRPNNRNTHPTVKPLDLMLWLIRLITPRGGIAFDPFCGSGSTICAAAIGGFSAIGMDNGEQEGTIEIARRRVAYWASQGRHEEHGRAVVQSATKDRKRSVLDFL